MTISPPQASGVVPSRPLAHWATSSPSRVKWCSTAQLHFNECESAFHGHLDARFGRHAIVRRRGRTRARFPEARPPIRARTSEPVHLGDPTDTVSCGPGLGGVPLTFLATATSPCITGASRGRHSAAFGGIVDGETSWLSQTDGRRLVGRRIRLTGLLRKKPWKRGFFYQVVFPWNSSGLRLCSLFGGLSGTARRRRPRSPSGLSAPLRPAREADALRAAVDLLRERLPATWSLDATVESAGREPWRTSSEIVAG